MARRLIVSLAMGFASAFLTWVMIGNHRSFRPTGIEFEYLGEIILILLLPGMLAGVMVSGNIHIANTWIVALGNFIFYFGFVYLVLINWQKRRAKRDRVLRGDT